MFISLVQGMLPYLWVTLGLIFVQLILGVAVAIFVTKDFELKKLPDFLAFYAPKLLGWLVLELVPLIPPEVVRDIPGYETFLIFTAGAAKIAWGSIALAAVGGILGNLQTIGVIPASAVPLLKRVGVPPGGDAPSDGMPTGGES